MGQTPPPSEDTGREMIDFARLAPSVRDLRPWTWRLEWPRLDLFADRTVLPSGTDPTGRFVVISCGAALHYVLVGAAAAGWSSRTEILPPGAGDDHLATVRLEPEPVSPRARTEAGLLRARAVDPRRFVAWPVSAAVLTGLTASAVHGSAEAVPVTGTVERLRVELLASRARSAARERDRPAPRRFDAPADSPADAAQQARPDTGGLAVLATRDDTTSSWLDAGRLLCRLWVAAMERGLSLEPESQVTGIEETRTALRSQVLGGDLYPQLLLRLGWQELSGHPLPVGEGTPAGGRSHP